MIAVVQRLAVRLASLSGARTVVEVACGDRSDWAAAGWPGEVITVDVAPSVGLRCSTHPARPSQLDAAVSGSPLFDEVARPAVVVCTNAHRLASDPDALFRVLGHFSHRSLYVLVSAEVRSPEATSNVEPLVPTSPAAPATWTLEWLVEALRPNGLAGLAGYASGEGLRGDRALGLVVAGRHSGFGLQVSGPRIAAIIHSYNEADILGETVERLLTDGIRVVALDNWSTDGTWELLNGLAAKHRSLEVRRFPSEPGGEYHWFRQLKETERLAATLDVDWVIHHDADECRESPWPGVSLAEGIGRVGALGYNAIDFTVADFRYCRDAAPPATSGGWRERLDHFEFGRRSSHFLQVKAWRTGPWPVSLAESGGHDVKFPHRRVFPLKFFLRHYPLRSPEQARRKILLDRQPRATAERAAFGWHVQYQQYSGDSDYQGWPAASLERWQAAKTQQLRFTELLSGIGICPT